MLRRGRMTESPGLKQNDGKAVAFLSRLPYPKWIRFVVDRYLLTESTTTETTGRNGHRKRIFASTINVVAAWLILAFIALLGVAIAWQWRGL